MIRLTGTAANIRQMSAKLRAIDPSSTLAVRLQKIESGLSRADRLALIRQDLEDASSEIESLHEEIESWHSGMPENLQSSSKADDLSECLNQLEAVKEALEDVITEAGEVSFPGMM